jgi:hypothetical protein
MHRIVQSLGIDLPYACVIQSTQKATRTVKYEFIYRSGALVISVNL